MPRGVPTSKAGAIIMVAALAAPLLIKYLKPAAKAIGEGIIKFGENLRDAAEDQQDPVRTKKEQPVQAKKTTAKPSAKTASPTGGPEIDAQKAASATPKAKARGVPPKKTRPSPSKNKLPKANTPK